MIDSLPYELVAAVIRHCNLTDVITLKRAMSPMALIDKIPTLSLAAYKQSTISLGKALGFSHRMKLDLSCLADESFLFLVTSNHAFEVIRVLRSRKAHQISGYAKQAAFKEVIGSNYHTTMAIELLLDDEINPNVITPYNCFRDPKLRVHAGTPLHWAAEHGLSTVVSTLLTDQRVNVLEVDEGGDQAIHAAACGGHLDTLRLIMDDPRIDPDALGCQGWRPLHYAVHNGCFDVLKELLCSSKVDYDSTTTYCGKVLHIACGAHKSANCVEIIKLLLKLNNIDPNFVSDTRVFGQQIPLHCAISAGNVDAVNVLLADVRINPRVRDTNQMHAFDHAIATGNNDILDSLRPYFLLS
jgi:ankyrin repeat protein